MLLNKQNGQVCLLQDLQHQQHLPFSPVEDKVRCRVEMMDKHEKDREEDEGESTWAEEALEVEGVRIWLNRECVIMIKMMMMTSWNKELLCIKISQLSSAETHEASLDKVEQKCASMV